ncbi:MAG: redox-sensing transcriptional repressor Rex [Tissierellia bacterium]|nr:redox-sensing transcriptional repressor Rex [Tissierellia bacterium]
MQKKKISITVIRRLPKYYRKLEDLERIKISRVSSQELSDLTGFTASQIRQDLNNFGGFGLQGYGYNVKELKSNLGEILGLNSVHNTCIVGAGNLGSAIANFKGFEDAGFKIVAILDSDKDIIGKKISGIKVESSDNMEKLIKDKDIEIAVLTVSKKNAQDVAEELEEAGIKSIWNLTTADLDVSENVIVEDVSLKDSLFTLSYFMREKHN